jgi:hypothetical protein
MLTDTSRIMPYGVTVGALAIIFIIIEIVFIAQRKLIPATMMLLSFILLVLFIAGIIGTAIQLFAGPNVNNLCNQYVFNSDVNGPNANTLAYLQQRNICEYSQILSQRGMNVLTGPDRSMLASRVRILDHREYIPGLDDGDGLPGQLEPIRSLSLESLSSERFHFDCDYFFFFFFFFIYLFFFDTSGHVYTMGYGSDTSVCNFSSGVQACLRDTDGCIWEAQKAGNVTMKSVINGVM